MPLPGFITKIFSGGIKDVISSVGSIVDDLTLSKEEKENLKIKLFDSTNKHIETMAALAQAETDSYLKDMDSARNMQIEALKQDDKFSKRFIYWFSAGIVLMTFIFDFTLLYVQYPERNHDLINVILGVLNSGCLISIMNFFYGSTKGSEKKTESLEKMAMK